MTAVIVKRRDTKLTTSGVIELLKIDDRQFQGAQASVLY